MTWRQDGLFGGAGVAKTVLIQELYQQHREGAWWLFGVCPVLVTYSRRQRISIHEMIEFRVKQEAASTAPSAQLVCGQMNEPPDARLPVLGSDRPDDLRKTSSRNDARTFVLRG